MFINTLFALHGVFNFRSASNTLRKKQRSRLKWYGQKRRRIRREESDGDGGAGENKERKTKAGCLYNINNDLFQRELSGEDAQDRTKWRRLIRDIDPT